MKRLHLIRHAKSSWNDSSLADIDRPLNQRGIDSCALMAAHMVKAGCSFEHVFCSPAMRAQSTIENIAHVLSGGAGWDDTATDTRHGSALAPGETRKISWTTDPALYTFSMKDLLAWCRQLDDALSEVVVVGHNAAMTDFFNTVSDQLLDNLPTCGYAQILVNAGEWQSLAPGTGEVLSLLTPKMFNTAISK